MKIDAIKQVLSFQAFRPDADDPGTAVPQRMIGKKFVCISISKGHVSWRGVDRKGKFTAVGQVEGEFSEVASGLSGEWQGLSDGGWVVVSINNRFVLTLESNLSRKPGTESLIRTNARAVIGAKYDRGKKYAIHHNPETSASLLLACEESMIRAIEDALDDLELKPARIACGLFAMVEDYLRRQVATGAAKRDFVLIACCDGSVCVLSQKKGQWSELRARGGFFAGDDIEPVMNIAAPLINGSGSGVPIVLLHDRPGTPMSQALFARLQPHGAVDVSQPEHLWMVLTQN